jgi:hypothetical protein
VAPFLVDHGYCSDPASGLHYCAPIQTSWGIGWGVEVPTEIFRAPGDAEELRLILEDDGLTITLWRSSIYPLTLTSETLTVEQARHRFPQYSSVIDDALANRSF